MAPKGMFMLVQAVLTALLLIATFVFSDDTSPIPADKGGVETWFKNNVKPASDRKGTLDPGLVKAEQSRKVIKVGDGGDFKTISEAIDSIPEGNSERVVVHIGGGKYNEQVKISRTKPFISLYGDPGDMPTLTHALSAEKVGTFDSATLIVLSDYFSAANIIVENSSPKPERGSKNSQALALRITGDKAAFYNCKFKGFQDTVCDDRGKHFFKDCYIEGTVDFIFGTATSLYLNNQLYVIGGHEMTVVAAQARETGTVKNGFSFVHCTVSGTGTDTYLGRAWVDKSTIVYAYSTLGSNVNGTGWTDYKHPETDSDVYFGEYKNTGPGATSDSRVKFSKQLSESEVQSFLQLGHIQGSSWLLPPPSA